MSHCDSTSLPWQSQHLLLSLLRQFVEFIGELLNRDVRHFVVGHNTAMINYYRTAAHRRYFLHDMR